ncbi:hypothetical protein COCCADRAFT_6708 [Bipolaris zeicola 26-R-13]|uniref:BHLH domain-containing protein n=1 Tax=Cochliobolus carbonum (strain 26-R-13) TaxID=930089 RepID=W6Y7U5_COCC2|nr:uncharacterized protein COCCADRAFT_6708 [Bipolaris zeicola 26-R-13]EUC31409.1 hypothetical protein COCCADRAFT_6708 [Bipolaris zeicola 26-R-13]
MVVHNLPAFTAGPDPTYSPPESETFPSPDDLGSPCYGDSYPSLSEYTSLDSNSGPCFTRPSEPVDPTNSLNWNAPLPDGFMSPPSAIVCPSATHGLPTSPQFAPMWQTGVPTPLSTSGDFQHGYISPEYTASSAFPPSVPSPLPTPSNHGSPASLSPVVATNPTPSPQDPISKPLPRKRGRPRIHRPASEPSAIGSSTSPAKHARTQCMPHTEVERKYREKLNAELERLRKAVPLLPQSDASSESGGVKPSKSMVLAVAIDYIKELERQRDLAVEEVERLGGKVKFGRVGGWRRGSEDS